MTEQEYVAALARNEKIGKWCRDTWYLLASCSTSAFIMEWMWIGITLIGVSVGFYMAWGRCCRRALTLMDERFKSLEERFKST